MRECSTITNTVLRISAPTPRATEMKIDQARPVAPDASSGVARAARNLGPHGFRNGLRLLTLLREFGGRGVCPLREQILLTC
jgi:hypothetical protein